MIDFNALLENEKKEKGYGPNREQREVIFSDKNTIVSAGAGAGKTTVLSYRFLRLVLEGKAKVDEILTLTFTRKAAAEMHTRILKQLLKYKDEAIVAKQLELFSSASISTLDSFCSQIVRADCLRYGIARDFSITSESLEGEESVLQLANEMIEDDRYKKPLSILARSLDITNLYSKFFIPLSRMCSILTKLDVDYVINELEITLRKKMEDNRVEALCIINHLIDEYLYDLADKSQSSLLENKRILESAEYDKKLLGLNRIRVDKKPYGEEFKEDFYSSKALWDESRDCESVLSYIDEEKEVLLLAHDFIIKMQKSKREKGELSFTDVGELAVDILKTNKEIRSYFKNKFKYIMIDEFQDNNALQKELLYYLGEDDAICLDDGITADNLNKNKLFFVGDEKQSIYRFRGADVSVFKALAKEIEKSNGNVLTLSANYRSEPLIIEHVNTVFRKLFKGEKVYEAGAQDALTRFDMMEGQSIQPLKSVDGDAINSSVNVFILQKEEKIDVDEKEELLDSESEAYFVADKIQEIVSGGKYKIKGGAAPTWSDIAILLRTGSNQMNFEKALLSKGIPYTVEESRSLMLEAIASDLYSALQYLLYPEDMSAYIALLRSPFVRLNDSAIYNIRVGKNDELSDSDKEKIANFSTHIEKASNLLKGGAITALLDYLYYNTGYYTYILANPKYHAYLENYDTIWALARDYEAEGYSITAFLSYLRENMASSAKLNSTPGWKEGQNGVKILTIHKSKGLEYPIVFISDAGSGTRKGGNPYPFKTQFGLCTDLPNVKFSTLLGDDDSDKEKAEMLRVLYVAATRAMNHLFITGKLTVKADGELGSNALSSLLGQYMVGLGAYSETGAFLGNSIIDISSYPSLSKKDIEKKIIKGDEGKLISFANNVLDKNFKQPLKKVNASALVLASLDCTNSTQLPPLDCDEIIIKNNLIAEFGTFCHLLCEYAVKGEKFEDEKFSKGMLSDKENEIVTSSAIKMVKELMVNDYFKSLLERGRSECEVRFFMPYEDTILEGVADLIIVANDYCLVLDYKTDKEFVRDNHKAQLLSYIKAVSELYGGKKTYGSLIYLRSVKKEAIWDIDGREVELI